MKEKWTKWFQKFKNPPGWILVLTYILTILSIAGALSMLLVDYVGTVLEIVAYILFGVSALSLAYSVYTIVVFAPRFRRKTIERLEQNAFTNTLMQNYGFRTVVFSIGSFVISIAYGIYNGFLGILTLSIWYGALAAYHIMLAIIRGSVLLSHKSRRANKQQNHEVKSIKTYRNCGALLVVLNLALSVAIAQMIFSDKFFVYADWTIFAAAAYAFYKITMSIINFFKARKQTDLTVQAIRNINITDGLVSILALQTALLHTFQEGDVSISLFNTLTGSVVSLANLSLGIFMIVKANRRLKMLKTKGQEIK